MTIPPLGRLRGLQACASTRGTFTILALDHRRNLRHELRSDDPTAVTFEEMVAFKFDVLRSIGDTATGILLDPEVGVAQAIASGALPTSVGLVVALEETGYGGSSAARRSRLLPGWSVAAAKRIGADGVKLLVYYHPDARTAGAQERLVARTAEACARHDLALFLEPLTYSPDPSARLTGEARRGAVVAAARRLTALGGDILKSEFPYDAAMDDETRWREACEEISAVSRVPWVLLSAGVEGGTFERQVAVACRAGASGVLAGRSVWGPAARLHGAERMVWLAGEGHARLERLARLSDGLARPWTATSPLASLEAPGDGWYLRD